MSQGEQMTVVKNIGYLNLEDQMLLNSIKKYQPLIQKCKILTDDD